MNKLLIRLLIGILILLPTISLVSPVAAEEAISVVANNHQNEFPTQVKFGLEATSSSDITKVTLYYKLQGSSVLTLAYPKFDQGKRIKTEYVWNTQSRYIPPGVEIRYYWVIEDASGNKLKTEQKSFTVEDVRFKWQKVGDDKITIYWYDGDTSFGKSLLGFAEKSLERTSQEIGATIQEPVKIYIYANNKDLLGALEPKAQEWTGGRSFSEIGIIALMVEPSASGLAWAERAVPHELNHVVVHQATANPYGDIPQWLSEGLAMHAEGPQEASYKRSLDEAIKSNHLISLKSLASNFPADGEQARLSYAESYSVVDFILRQYGREKMQQLLAVFKEGSDYDDALMAALGVDVAGLETAWRASLGLGPIEVPQDAVAAATKVSERQGSQSNSGQNGGICPGILEIIGLAGAALALGLKFARA